MNIQVNGEAKTFQDGITVTDLLETLDIRSEQVAVELNLKILDRGDFPQSMLQNGDTVEILSFIGGGATVHLHDNRRHLINTQSVRQE